MQYLTVSCVSCGECTEQGGRVYVANSLRGCGSEVFARHASISFKTPKEELIVPELAWYQPTGLSPIKCHVYLNVLGSNLCGIASCVFAMAMALQVSLPQDLYYPKKVHSEHGSKRC